MARFLRDSTLARRHGVLSLRGDVFSMHPILLELGPFTVRTFGTLVILAFLAGTLIMRRDLLRKGVGGFVAVEVMAFAALGGLLGARLNQAFHFPELFLAAPVDFLLFNGGLIWYGGLLGGIIATLWPIRRARLAWASFADSACLGLLIGLAIGRVGCHVAGDGDWGSPTDLPWGVAYTNGIAPWPHPPGVFVHPAPLYELAALLLIFGFLWRSRERLVPDGAVFAAYLLLTSIARFLVEVIRVEREIALGLTEAQWVSLFAALAGAWFLKAKCRWLDAA